MPEFQVALGSRSPEFGLDLVHVVSRSAHPREPVTLHVSRFERPLERLAAQKNLIRGLPSALPDLNAALPRRRS